jgi:hypothetical protein
MYRSMTGFTAKEEDEDGDIGMPAIGDGLC